MANDPKHIKYTTNDIRRYLDGIMGADEMHALEKAALDDPFLADAIDGMRLSDEKSGAAAFASDVAELKGRLKRKRRPGFGMVWKAAAMVIVIGTGIAVSYFLQESDKRTQVVVSNVETGEDSAAGDSSTSTTLATPDTSAAIAGTSLQENAASERKADRTTRNQSHKDERKSVMPPAAASAESSKIPEKREEVQDAVGTAPDSVSNIDEMLQGKAAGITVEKAQGKAATDSLAPTEHELSEVVVTGYGKRERAAEAGEFRNTNSLRYEPAGGWDAFHRYIHENKKLTAQQENNIQQVAFRIAKNGRPVNFRMVRSISRLHDEAIVRLLKEGPSWRVLKGRKREVILEVRF